MARRAAPWRRESESGAWYACVKGKQEWLAPAEATKAQAHEELDKLRVGGKPRPTGAVLLFGDLMALFLADCRGAVERGELKEVTREGYVRYLEAARGSLGKLPVDVMRPTHVSQWLGKRPSWGSTSRFNAITAVKRVCNWGVSQGILGASPIAKLERPAPNTREAVLSPVQVTQILGAVVKGDPFRDLLEALAETGARPGEVCSVTADRVDHDAGTWTVANKTARKTGVKWRTVYLSPRALAISRRLAGSAQPNGHLFINTKGRPWTRNAIAQRFDHLGQRLGMGAEAVAYSFRHRFATDALLRGVPPATVAELMGHRDITMIMRIYNQLRAQTDHLRAAAAQARGSL